MTTPLVYVTRLQLRGDPYVEQFLAELPGFEPKNAESSINRAGDIANRHKAELSDQRAFFVDTFGVEVFANPTTKPVTTLEGIRFWRVAKPKVPEASE